MKAVVYENYGPPAVLRFKEVEKPAPADDEVLVAVQAAALNASDLDYLRGRLLNRLGAPLRPRNNILGTDIAGRVEAVGRSVELLKPGDDVFGDLTESGFGAFAEYVCVPEDALALKPVSMPFEEAAAVPTAAVIALQGLRNKGQIQRGQKVLINGAGGGVGTFAVQIAKTLGAEVTGVDSAPKLDMVRALGADRVIDYTREDLTKSEARFDVILDIAAHRSVLDYRRVMSHNGVYVLVGGSVTALLQTIVLWPWTSKIGSRKIVLLAARTNRDDLASVRELLEAGEVSPVIDRRYPLSECAAALRYLEGGHSRGKVVITVDHEGRT